MASGSDAVHTNVRVTQQEYNMVKTFKYHKPGHCVPSDGNCGLYALCKVLYDDHVAATPNAMLYCIFFLFELHDYPNYWWSDEELAVIADHFGYDTYIYNETEKTGIVFGRGTRPPVVLYSVDDNTHWMPGTRTLVPSSSYIPEQFTVIENVADVLTIEQITQRLRRHLLDGSRGRGARGTRGGSGGNGGAGGSNSGAGGSNSGAGGSNSGASGSNSGASGSNSGAGGSNSGASGSNSGAGGSSVGGTGERKGSVGRNGVVDVVKAKSLCARIKTAVLDKLDRMCSWRIGGGRGYRTMLQQGQMVNAADDIQLMLSDAEKITSSVYYFYRNSYGKSKDSDKLPLLTIGASGSDTAAGDDDGSVDDEVTAAYADVTKAWLNYWAEQRKENQVDDAQPSVGEADEDKPVVVQPLDSELQVENVVEYGEENTDGDRVYVRKRAVPRPSDSELDEDLSALNDDEPADAPQSGSELEDDGLGTLDDGELVNTPRSGSELEDDGLVALNDGELVNTPRSGSELEDDGLVALNDDEPADVQRSGSELEDDGLGALNDGEPVDARQSDSEVEVLYGRAYEGDTKDDGRVYVRKRAVPLPSTSDSDEDLRGSDGAERGCEQASGREKLCDQQDAKSAATLEVLCSSDDEKCLECSMTLDSRPTPLPSDCPTITPISLTDNIS